MKNIIIAAVIVIGLAGIGFVIYQQINTLEIELQQKAVLEELRIKYEFMTRELSNEYEAEIKRLEASNMQSSRQYEAEIKKLRDELARKIESAANTGNDKNKNVLAVIRKLHSTADIITDKTIVTDPATFIVHDTRANYRDYSTKVTDTKIELDRCLEDSKDTLPADARELILKAMDCYKDAMLIWEMESNDDANARERKEEPKEENEKRTRLERMKRIKDSAFYSNKYSGLISAPYSIMVPEGYILVPLKAVTFVWAQAAQYIREADAILSRNVK